MLRWIAILLLGTVLGSSLISVSAAPPSAPRVPEWATKFLSAWYYSYNRGDASGVAALFSENARLEATEGRAEIQKTLAAEFEKTRNAGKAARTKEQWLLVFEMAAPGQWLLTRETYEGTD